MSYEYHTEYDSPNYTAGRPYGIKCIAIHWWGDPNTHPSFEGVIATLCKSSRQASAHYVAEAGRVACLVDCGNRAWANGDGVGVGSLGNDMSISIECNPRQSDGDYNTIAELIRDIRAVYGDLPLYPHNKFSATQCPGTYDLARLDRLARNGASGSGNTNTNSSKPNQNIDIDALAWAVIRGDYGNGVERRRRLGANYDRVQARVNELLS